MLTWLRILWPSFLMAGLAGAAFFMFVDPTELSLMSEESHVSPTTVYTIGFFVLWAFTAASSGLTCYLQRSADEVNNCPLDESERPSECAKRR